ncbi:hypothetical protein E2P81_ATG07131 [Venturia nashicola]|uniref:Uncharacterized protein n=1 Tax=Venturia nashicola TaxID=86259 RepID=A0A4Z1NZ79_9PEZI|nr:hypothetical protein E6O75_ATG07294 [Venturia nashicola]TLD19514.1 hypothetical protein E2P81_ATG07131 [Venturia nashicola]
MPPHFPNQGTTQHHYAAPQNAQGKSPFTVIASSPDSLLFRPYNAYGVYSDISLISLETNKRILWEDWLDYRGISSRCGSCCTFGHRFTKSILAGLIRLAEASSIHWIYLRTDTAGLMCLPDALCVNGKS